jgi:signal transduction histidine kinase
LSPQAAGASPLEERLVALFPKTTDATQWKMDLIDAGLSVAFCNDLQAVRRELGAGAAAVLLPEEALVGPEAQELAADLHEQPLWSDLPIILISDSERTSAIARWAQDALRNVILLGRALHPLTLRSVVTSALRARACQYQRRAAEHHKDELLALLGHELRNPLAPLRHAVHVLKSRDDNDPQLRELVALMDRKVTHIVRLVDDLVDVSRLTRGKLELHLEWVDVGKIVDRAVEDVCQLMESRHHHWHVSLPEGPLRLRADPARLEQVLANLLGNAAKYTAEGGDIELSAERHQEGPQEDVILRVRDNGIGIPPEQLEKVFDPFQQADRLKGQVSEGLGLGLTLVQLLVGLHGGSVEAHSEGVGCGSEFVVHLPAGTEQEGPPSRSTSLPSKTRALRVLIVDDNRDSAESLALLLRLRGHEVRTVYDGPAALKAAPAFRPQVVLLDIGLPLGMDGYEIAQQMRQQPELQGAALIALTGYGQEEDRHRSALAGLEAHLVKPVDPAVLVDLLNQLQGG